MRILFFGHLKEATGCAEIVVPGEAADADELWLLLSRAYPWLERHRPSVRLARNWEYVGPKARFADSDEVALIPPVSGG